MNIAILGAGAMGSLFGGLLAETGASVTLLDINQQHLDAIRRDGLRLETDDPTNGRCARRITQLAVSRPEAATQIPDLLMIFTKTHQIRAADAALPAGSLQIEEVVNEDRLAFEQVKAVAARCV